MFAVSCSFPLQLVIKAPLDGYHPLLFGIPYTPGMWWWPVISLIPVWQVELTHLLTHAVRAGLTHASFIPQSTLEMHRASTFL